MEVPAPVEEVWAVLTDLPGYAEWNPFTTRARSTLRVGDRVVLRVRLGWLTITQVEWVSEVSPPHVLSWRMARVAPWLLRAERVQTLTEAPGGCAYQTVDTIGGWLEPVVGWLFGRALEEGFTAMAEALAAHITNQCEEAGRPVPR